jgi:predicted extracellular nuclease
MMLRGRTDKKKCEEQAFGFASSLLLQGIVANRSPAMFKVLAPLVAAATSATALTIAEINGNKFISPFKDQNVTDIKGLVTAKGSQGVYLRSTEPDEDPATSEGIYVFNRNIINQVAVGDVITLDGRVVEYRSAANYPYLTELDTPKNVVVVSSKNEVKPLVVGVDTLAPPTEDFSSLDVGGVFGVPNGVNSLSGTNPELDPAKYGLDFWESLVGELVTIKDAYQVSRPNQYGDVWVRGDWPVTGLNSHGGVTMLEGDANPETIVIGSPLDGSKNPGDTRMGDYIGDVTGVVTNAFGFYRVLPVTNISPLKNATTEFPSVSFESKGTCKGITVGVYNAENLAPQSAHLPLVIDQIVEKLKTPDLIMLQEVQDNSGPTNEKSGLVYAFAEVAPEDGKDGGQPGGNIRVAYLYRPDVIELYKPNIGRGGEANEVLESADGPVLKYNPGRIDPSNSAFSNSRKPLIAQWKTVRGTGKTFFTVNVHFSSKGGSAPIHGDPRPPLNGAIDSRQAQAEITGDFIGQIMELDPEARIVAAGDFNEFTQVQPMQTFLKRSGLIDLEEAVDLDPTERYTYLFDMNCQSLDHVFISPSLGRGALYEHLHLNTWQNFDDQVSDHDPSVARFNMCGCASRK